MAALNFPEALADGQTFEADTGVVYVYQGNPPTGFWSATSTKDGQQNQDARYVQVAGDKMTGNLLIGGTGANSDFITLTAQNGNAEFKGEVTLTNGQINTRLSDGRLTVGDYNNEASTAIYKGNISIAKDADTCLDIYGGYNVATPNISLRADGTGDFSKNINVSGSARIGGLQAASAATAGVDILSTGVVNATASGGNNPVFIGQTQGANVSTAKINANGTANFVIDGVVIGSYLGGDLVVQGDQSGGFTYLTRTRAQGYANVGDSSPTWYLDNATGQSGFNGFTAVGGLVYNGENGVNFYPEGRIDIRRADAGDVLWAGHSPTSYTSLIRGDGTAEFVRGTTQIGAHSYEGGANTTSFINTGFLRLPVPADYTGDQGSGGWVSFAITDTAGSTTCDIRGDGSASFAGNIQNGGNPDNGNATGWRGLPGGGIQVSGPDNDSSLWRGYKTGTASPTSYINADGQATFANTLSITGGGVSVQYGPIELYAGSPFGRQILLNTDGAGTFGNRASTGDWIISPTQGIRYNNGSEELTILGTGGSASFAGGISLLSTTNNGMQINSEGEITVQRSSGSSILFRGYDSTTNSLNIFANGACELAGNTCFVTSGGSILLNNSGNASGSARTTLNSNGNASFAGFVQIGGAAGSGAQAGVAIGPSGYMDLTNASTNPILYGYTQGDNQAKLVLYANGNATFNGALAANSLESFGAGGGVIVKSPNGTRYRITVDDSGNISATVTA